MLKEQERQVIHDLSQAVREKDRAFAVVQTNLNRHRAARQPVDLLEKAAEAGRKPDPDRLLDAHGDWPTPRAHHFLGARRIRLGR